uniref:FAD_binding_6 domain-containing protein n=1 Tax=Parastrongyloides trichosuri TaxID=131310 RepID=A0A0N5A2U4_PARTI
MNVKLYITNENGDEIERFYTPTSVYHSKTLDLIIKIFAYNSTAIGYSNKGMTGNLKKLRIGDHIEASGPHGNFTYEGFGTLVRYSTPHKLWLSKMYRKIIVITSGVALNVAINLCRTTVDKDDRNVIIKIITLNDYLKDIVFYDELEDIVRRMPNTFEVMHILKKEMIDGEHIYSGETLNFHTLETLVGDYHPGSAIIYSGSGTLYYNEVYRYLKYKNFNFDDVYSYT